MMANESAFTFSITDTSNVTALENPDNEYLPLACIMAVVGVSILGNSSVIAAFFRDARLRVIFNLFVVHLSTADLMTNCVVLVALADEMTQTSILGRWSVTCQVCTVFANALPLEQLVLTHLMCNDRHRALQNGISYARMTSHWHVEKLMLFLTWVLSFVCSFLITDLMTTVKLYGQGSCKFPARLLYINYTSFFHFAMLMSLVAVVVYITVEFRQRRNRSSSFERLQVDPEDDFSICRTCRTCNNAKENRILLQSLVPRSPLNVSREYMRLWSPDSQASISQSLISSKQLLQLQIMKTKPEISIQPGYETGNDSDLSGGLPLDSSSSGCSLNVDKSEYRHESHKMDVKQEGVTQLGEEYEDIQQVYKTKYVEYKTPNRKSEMKQIVGSELSAKLGTQNIGRSVLLDLGIKDYINFKKHIKKSLQHETDSHHKHHSNTKKKLSPSEGKRDSAGISSMAKEIKSEIAEKVHAVNRSVQETNKEVTVKEAAEDLFRSSISLSDDDLADVPLLHLRPRSGSMFTLRSYLSKSDESLTKTTEEFIDLSNQSDGSTPDEASWLNLKAQRKRRNACTLFSIGDENEGGSETICRNNINMKHDFINLSTIKNLKVIQRSSEPVENLLNHSSNENDHHFEPSHSCARTLVNGEDNYLNKMQKACNEKIAWNKETHNIPPLGASSSESDLTEEHCLTLFHNNDKLINGDSFINKTLSKSRNKESLPQARPTIEANIKETNFKRNNIPESILLSKINKDRDLPTKQCYETSERLTDQMGVIHNDNKLPQEAQCSSFIRKNFSNDNNSAGAINKEGDTSLNEPDTPQQNTTNTSEKVPQAVPNTETISPASVHPVTTPKKRLPSFTAASAKYETKKIENEPNTKIESNFLHNHLEQAQTNSALATDVRTGTKHNCDIIHTDPSEYRHSQSDIEYAVDSWMKFYDIKVSNSNREILTARKCADSLPPWPENGSSAALSEQSPSIESARQIWLDFYGIDMTERKASQLIKHHPNGHLVSCSVDILSAGSLTFGDKAADESTGKQYNSKYNSTQFSPFPETSKSNFNNFEQSKSKKLLKHVLKFKRADKLSHSLYEFNKKARGRIYPLLTKSARKDYKESSSSMVEQQYTPAEESIPTHATISPSTSSSGFPCNVTRSDQNYATNPSSDIFPSTLTRSKDAIQHDASINIHPMFKSKNTEYPTMEASPRSTTISDKFNNIKGNNSTTNLQACKENAITALENNLISHQSFSSLKSVNTTDNDSNCERSVSGKRWTSVPNLCSDTYLIHEPDIQSKDSEVTTEVYYSNEMIYPSAIDAIETTSDAVGVANDNNLNYIVARRHNVVQTEPNLKEKQNKLRLFVNIRDPHAINISDTFGSEKRSNRQGTDIFQITKQAHGSAQEILGRPRNGGKREEDEELVQACDYYDEKDNVTEATYEILESMSVTCRAFLSELGIYRDILTGVIPIDNYKLQKSELRDTTPCPDCERREQNRTQRLSDLAGKSPTGSTEAVSFGSERDGDENTSTNASMCRDGSPQHASIQLTALSLHDTSGAIRQPADKSQNSSLKMDEFEDLDPEAGVSRAVSTTSTVTTKNYNIMRFPRRIPHLALVAIKRASFEQLKIRDPELCILVSLIGIVLLQLICWLPITIMYMAFDVVGYPVRPGRTEIAFLCLWCLRMATQPLLYACYSIYFRENYAQILCCHWRR